MLKNILTMFIVLAVILSGSGVSQASAKLRLNLRNSQKSAIESTDVSIEKTQNQTKRKRALLIGIDKYRRTGKADEWGNLNTTLDLELLQKVLIEKFKFAPEDIVVLKDQQATKNGILSAWRKIVAQTEKGDIVFIHYSGHGDSIPDDNGDEIDGLDESLIPFDYVSKKDYSKNIRDDEIGKILDELKLKQPGNVTVSLDSCYSGTATRGDYAVRGGSGYWQDHLKPGNESPSGLEDKSDSYPKEYVFLAAASPRQTAKETSYDETRRMGVYTLALVKALSNITPNTTYRDLFERINDSVTTIRTDQNPQIEGSLDELVLDGTAVRQERFAEVRPLAGGKKEDKAILQAGRLQGATPKSRYALFESGTKDPNEPGAVKIADAEILEADATTSVLKLDRQIEPEKLRTARAFETAHNYAEANLRVVLQDLGKVKGGDAVLTEFVGTDAARGGNGASSSSVPNSGLAQFSQRDMKETMRGEDYDIKVYPAGEQEVKDKIVPVGFRGIVMERNDGSTIARISEDKNFVSEIKNILEKENRFLMVKSLKDTEDSRLKIALRVVPVNVELDSLGRIKTAQPKADVPRNSGGLPEMKVGDYIMLEVENKGDLDAYVTILNLRSDGKIAPGFPQNVSGTPDNFIKKGQKILIPAPYIFRITEPLGEESFRAIATVDPTDFTPLIDEDLIKRTGPLNARGRTAENSPLGKILIAAQRGTRGGELGVTVPPSWATSSSTYLVKAKE